MKKRILFVDDEQNILQGLRRMLRSMRHEWEMEFADSGCDALELLSGSSFDVIVSDMRMPGMDGAELLSEVKSRYPQIVRIILSGQSNKEMVMKSIGPTHMYISKPCSAEKLKTILNRAFTLRDLLKNDQLRKLVSDMKSLPTLPTLYYELMRELESTDTTMTRVGEIISKDVGMTAKILQSVNSVFFGIAVHVKDPVHAAKLLGLDIIKSLVLSAQIFTKFDQAKLSGLSLEQVVNHSLGVASFAKQIALSEVQDRKIVDNAMIGGMLHDAGKLVLSENLPDKYQAIFDLTRKDGLSLWKAEREIITTTHAEVGAYLLGLWGLPDPIIEAVAYHHAPQQGLDKSFSPLTAIHVANIMEYELCETDANFDDLDYAYLDELGLTNKLPEWRQLCMQTVNRG